VHLAQHGKRGGGPPPPPTHNFAGSLPSSPPGASSSSLLDDSRLCKIYSEYEIVDEDGREEGGGRDNNGNVDICAFFEMCDEVAVVCQINDCAAPSWTTGRVYRTAEIVIKLSRTRIMIARTTVAAAA
jgi:hypothetical protein